MTNNLEFHSVTLTPDVVHCLHNVLARAQLLDAWDVWLFSLEA